MTAQAGHRFNRRLVGPVPGANQGDDE